MKAVELAPIVKTVDVGCPPGRAFRAFTREMGAWWPLATHTRARPAAGERAVNVTVEPRVGGRIFESLEDGRELDWGEVLAWEPSSLLTFSWHLGAPPEQATQVAVRFEALGEDACRVTLTHSQWERLGEAGLQGRESYDNGWATVFVQRFGGYVGLR